MKSPVALGSTLQDLISQATRFCIDSYDPETSRTSDLFKDTVEPMHTCDLAHSSRGLFLASRPTQATGLPPGDCKRRPYKRPVPQGHASFREEIFFCVSRPGGFLAVEKAKSPQDSFLGSHAASVPQSLKEHCEAECEGRPGAGRCRIEVRRVAAKRERCNVAFTPSIYTVKRRQV